MRPQLRTLIPSGVLALVLLPAAAHAASGSLVLWPDWTGKLPALIVLFVLLIGPTNRLVIKPLLRVLDERESRTVGTRARAARLDEEAREVIERFEREVAKTRAETERVRQSTLERVRAEALQVTGGARGGAEQSLEAARRELTGALEEARQGLRSQAQELARETASRVLGRSL